MPNFRFVVSGLIVLGITAHLPAQIIQSKKGYVINVGFKKGQVLKQNMTMQAIGNTKLKSTSQFITKCIDVDKKGFATLDVTVPSTDGKTKPVKKRMKVDRHGKPIGATIDGYSGTFVWPETPVKVGQSWLGDISMGGPGQGSATMALKSTYKLTGFKTLNGVKVASISAVLKVTGTYDISGDGMIYVRYSDGQLQSADFNMALGQFSESGTGGKLHLKMMIRTLP